MTNDNVAGADGWQVVGLCAQWCGVCREWRAAFDAVAARHPQAGFRWLDVEDDEELVGDIDVETFPTVLVAHAGRALFLGPIAPHAAVLEQLLKSLAPDAPEVPDGAALLLQLQPFRIAQKGAAE